MKRRSFLGISISAMGVPVVSSGTSLYGTPVSVTGPVKLLTDDDDTLRFTFSTTYIPESMLSKLSILSNLWRRVLGNQEDKQRFSKDPAHFLTSNGVPLSLLNSRDHEVRMLIALCDDSVLASSIRGDYREFLGKLDALGVLRTNDSSQLRRSVTQMLKADLEGFRTKLAAINRSPDGNSARGLIDSDEIRYLYTQLAPAIDQVATAAVAVNVVAVILAAVAAYVTVVTTVTVGILAGVAISVAAAMAVTASVSGGRTHGMLEHDHQGEGEQLVCGVDDSRSARDEEPVTPWSKQTARERRADRFFAERQLLSKRMLILDPERLREAQKAARMARVLGIDEFVIEANRQLVRDEVDTFISVAEDLDLIRLPDASRTMVMDSMKQLALKASGLA